MAKPTSPTERIRPDPVIEAYKKDIDRTLLRENLKLTPDERLAKLQRFVDAMRDVRGAARRLPARSHRGRAL